MKLERRYIYIYGTCMCRMKIISRIFLMTLASFQYFFKKNDDNLATILLYLIWKAR